MTAEHLLKNMVIGCKDPSTERALNDLGRFGAGLKTASFSQARRMTVFSWTHSSSIAAAQWDTDLVKREDRWCLLELSTAEIETELASLDRPNFGSGTMVCWDGIYSLEEAEDKYGAERIVAALVSDRSQQR